MLNLFDGTRAETRPYQLRITEKVKDHLLGDSPVSSVLVDSPTGSGKSVMGLALARLGVSLGKRVGWCAMRRNLLTQTQEMSKELGFGVEREMRMISMFDRTPPRDVDWLFVDEAQHDATSSMANIHAVTRPEKVIGLSATPFRTDRAKLSFDVTVRGIGIRELIEQDYLSKFDHYTIPSWGPRETVGIYLMDPEGWGQSVMFFLTMAECREAERLLRKAGVPCTLVWSGSDREQQIEDLRSGAVRVAISMSLLAEGLDAKEIRTVFVRPSGRGPTMQMTGRVLRRMLGCDAKRVVQCGDTRFPFVRAAPARRAFTLVGDRFLSVVPNENVSVMSAHCLGKLVAAKSNEMPAFLAGAAKQRRALQDRRTRRGDARGDRIRRAVNSGN